MLRDSSTSEHYQQAQLPLDYAAQYRPASSFDEFFQAQDQVGANDLATIASKEDFHAFMLPVEPLSYETQRKVASLSKIVQKSFEVRRYDVAGHIVSHFEASFRDFWQKRYNQYRCTARFYRRVATVFNLSVDQVKTTQAYLGLPSCTAEPTRNFDQYRFASCLYLDANEGIHDPLDRFYGRTIHKQSTLPAWETYLTNFAFLSPEMVDESDIRFLLKNYAIPLHRAAMLLQVKESELADYASHMNLPTSYHSKALPIRDLMGHGKHERLTRIILSCAQQLYTHQAVPLRVIAERIGIDVNQLFEMAERDLSEWVHPQLSTIHHVIEHTTLIHVQAGGVLRQNVTG